MRGTLRWRCVLFSFLDCPFRQGKDSGIPPREESRDSHVTSTQAITTVPRGPGQPSWAAFRCTADNWFAVIKPCPATPKPPMACDLKRKPTQLAGAPARSGTMRRCASTLAPASCKRSSEGTVHVGLSGPRSLGSTSWWTCPERLHGGGALLLLTLSRMVDRHNCASEHSVRASARVRCFHQEGGCIARNHATAR